MLSEVHNKRVVVFGLGHFGGGIAVARWLVEQGARVLVTDKETSEKLAESVAHLADLPIEYRLGDQNEADFSSADLIVTSPAVKPGNALLEVARRAGVPITTEIRLFIERCPATIIGVTGTKGKSTTASMLGAMLARRHTTRFGGNIGKSLLADLPRIGRDDKVILELSSFMLHYLEPMRWSPHIALVTLVAHDHLDWHGSPEAYVAAKQNIVRFQTPADFAVVSEECPESLAFGQHTPAKVLPYGTAGRKPFEIGLIGRHNQLNAQGAFAAAQCVGCTWDDAQAALRAFKPLPHRLELVHESAGVTWCNDSIATIPEAAVAAMDAFAPGTVVQIVGGSYKGLPFDDMAKALAQRAKAILTIGQTGPDIAALVRQHGGAAKLHECKKLPDAVATARTLAGSGDTVLLSTGCASYGEFDHFEARGEAFTKLARS